MDKKKLEGAIDALLKEYRTPADIVGPDGLLKQMTKALLERAMAAELTQHLGYEKHAASGRGSGNSRNGTSRKSIQGDFGEVELEVPRDRNGSFEPQIVGKHERRFAGFDDKIILMYARGIVLTAALWGQSDRGTITGTASGAGGAAILRGFLLHLVAQMLAGCTPGQQTVSAGHLRQHRDLRFNDFIRISGMTHVRTSPYYPQSNGGTNRSKESASGRGRHCHSTTRGGWYKATSSITTPFA
jgi:hypothetical protein